MHTIRQQMIDLLADRELNARELSAELSIMEKEVYAHLSHVERSLVRHGRQLAVSPWTCLGCGFQFTGRKGWKRPGRCPQCKQGHIRMASYRVLPAS